MGDPGLACRTVQRELRAGWLPSPPVSSVLFLVFCWGWGSFVSVWWPLRGGDYQRGRPDWSKLQLSNWHSLPPTDISEMEQAALNSQINCPADIVPRYRWDCHQPEFVSLRLSVPSFVCWLSSVVALGVAVSLSGSISGAGKPNKLICNLNQKVWDTLPTPGKPNVAHCSSCGDSCSVKSASPLKTRKIASTVSWVERSKSLTIIVSPLFLLSFHLRSAFTPRFTFRFLLSRCDTTASLLAFGSSPSICENVARAACTLWSRGSWLGEPWSPHCASVASWLTDCCMALKSLLFRSYFTLPYQSLRWYNVTISSCIFQLSMNWSADHRPCWFLFLFVFFAWFFWWFVLFVFLPIRSNSCKSLMRRWSRTEFDVKDSCRSYHG